MILLTISAGAGSVARFLRVLGVVVREVPEVLSDVEAPLEPLRRHKVLGDLDAVVDVPNLMGGPGRNEYGISLTLRNGVANHAILLEQARPQVAVEVDRLVEKGHKLEPHND